MEHGTGLNRRDFLKTASISAVTIGAGAKAAAAQESKLEHRNEHPDTMRYRRLGRTNLNVSAIGFGAMFISSDANNVRILDIALERGVNYVDTAWAYTKQQSETELGKLLKGKRDNVFLTTKVSPYKGERNKLLGDLLRGLTPQEQQEFNQKAMAAAVEQGAKEAEINSKGQNRSKAIIGRVRAKMMEERFGSKLDTASLVKFAEKTLEESLTRLQTDHVDVLFMPHGLDCADDARYADVREAWEKIKKAGKARFLGAPNHQDTVATLSACIESGIYDILMPCYCALNYNDPEDQDSVLAKAKAADLGVIAIKTLGSKVRDSRFAKQLGGKTFAAKINELVKGEGTPFQKAIAWVLSRPNVDMALVGFTNQQEVEEDLGAINVKIP